MRRFMPVMRAVAPVLLLFTVVLPGGIGQSVASAASSDRLSVVYGVTGKRHLQVSGRVSGAPRGSRALLQTRFRGKATLRARTRIRSGRLRLHWRYPRSARAIAVRVRVVSKRGRLVASGRWRTIRVSDLPRGARVAKVKASQLLSASPPGQPGFVVVKGKSSIRAGQFLALGVGAATPNGLLARVTAVTHGANTTVATVPATLPEIVPVGAVDLRLRAIPRADVRVRIKPRASSFGRLVKCTNGAHLGASGSASLTSDVSLSVGWSFPFRIDAKFEGEVRATSALSAAVTGAASCKLSPTALLARPIRLGAYTFTIGPVPVVLVPYVQFYLSANGAVEAAITTSATASLKANAGVRFAKNSFSPFGGLTPSFSFSPPGVSATGAAQAAISPTLDVLINGIGGPRIDLSAGLKLAADIKASPWWKVTAPISLGAQLRLDVWKLQLASERLQILAREPQIAAAQVAAPPPREPVRRAQLTWDNESDVDLHIWDLDGNHAYFGDLTAISGVRLVKDIIPGYGPEHFIEESSIGRPYVYGLCVFDGGDVTATLDVTDPSGATRQLTRYLPDRKSAALVTSSPPGAGYTPPPGWCGDDDPVTFDP